MMGYLEDLQSYLNLSRKELQILCKRNNLPANRSHTQLAKSLASFFKKKNAGPGTLKENSINFRPDAKRKEPENLVEDATEDLGGSYKRRLHAFKSYGNEVPPLMKEAEGVDKKQCPTGNLMTISSLMNHQASETMGGTAANVFCSDISAPNRSGYSIINDISGLQPSYTANIWQNMERRLGSHRHTGETLNELEKCSEPRNGSQAVVEHAASKNRSRNSILNTIPENSSRSAKGGFASSGEITKQATPSFEFFVTSDEGIDLQVDLNSTPSEWIDSLKQEVSSSLNMQESKSRPLAGHIRSFSEEADLLAKGSNPDNVEMNIHNNRHDQSGCTTSTLSSDSENCQSLAPQDSALVLSEATLAFSDSSVLTTSSTLVRMPGYSDGNQVNPSRGTPQKRMSYNGSSCPGGGIAFTGDYIDASSEMKRSNATPCGPPVQSTSDIGMLSPKGTSNTEKSEYTRMQIFDNFDTDSLGKSSTTITEENNLLKFQGTKQVVPTSYICNLEHDNDAFVEKKTKVGAVGVGIDCTSGNSVGKDPVSALNHELDKNTHIEDMDTSECSRSPKLSENNPEGSDSPQSQEEFNSKRSHGNVEYMSSTMVDLRSTRTSAKQSACEKVVRLRRSTRLLEVKSSR